MRALPFTLALAVAGCLGTYALDGLCLFPGASGKQLRALGREITGPAFRPDDAVREGDGGLWVSGAHDIGRLSLYFSGLPASGALPFDLTDGGCEATGRFVFLVTVDPDAGTATLDDEVVTGSLTVSPADSGTLFHVTGITATRPDGGARAVADRDLTVVVPAG